MRGARERFEESEETSDRILRIAAELFALRSYAGTTTRQIAEAVGIQQPSLFYHFPSKAHLVDALIEWDLGRIMPFVRELNGRSYPAAVRLYAYLAFDVGHLMESPYNLAGVYSEDVVGEPRFAKWRSLLEERRAVVRDTVQDGIDEGAFVQMSPALASETVTGVILGMLKFHSGLQDEDRVDHEAVVSLVLRGLLNRTADLQRVRTQGQQAMYEVARQVASR
jgi:AcrR family transcriptional regulator